MMVGIGNRWFEPAPEMAHLFVDLSNIYAGAQAASRSHSEQASDIRLQAENVLSLLSKGRTISTRLVVANSDVPDAVLARFRGAGFDVETREVGRYSHTEQANDELLQLRMLMVGTLLAAEPGVIVLATGDGNGWRRDRGFCPVLQRVRQHGWRTEVAAWQDSLNPQLVEVVASNGGRIELLDDSYFGVTFVEGGRRSQPIIHYPMRPAA